MSTTATKIELTLEERIQKLEDEAAIRDLAAAFADAASRNDKAALSAVWKKDGIFTIGAPLSNVSNGVERLPKAATSITTTMVSFPTRWRKWMASGSSRSVPSITCTWISPHLQGTPTHFLIRYLPTKESRAMAALDLERVSPYSPLASSLLTPGR